jgi:hypothetical protein
MNHSNEDLIKQLKEDNHAKDKEIARLKAMLKQQEKQMSEGDAAKEASMKAMMNKLQHLQDELKEKDRIREKEQAAA